MSAAHRSLLSQRPSSSARVSFGRRLLGSPEGTTVAALQIGVMGAGAIGVFLGLHAAAGGAHVTLVGRSSLLESSAELSATRLDGRRLEPTPTVVLSDDPEALAEADIVIVTVKSRDSTAVGERLATILPERATIVSFQNGLGNLKRLGSSLGPRVIAGMVSFNVIRDGPRLRQATRGPLIAGDGGERHDRRAHLQALAAALDAGGLPLELRPDIDDVIAGKLLLNLSNGVGAATGLPIAATLRSRDARICFARCIREGIAALTCAGYRPRSVIGLPPSLIASLLPLPNILVMMVARKMVSLDPQARSSTLQDLDAGKPTEIGDLNGAIADLAQAHGLQAPANQTITEIIRELETTERPLSFISPRDLRRRIAAASREA